MIIHGKKPLRMLPYPQLLEQCLPHSRASAHIYWMNEHRLGEKTGGKGQSSLRTRSSENQEEAHMGSWRENDSGASKVRGLEWLPRALVAGLQTGNLKQKFITSKLLRLQVQNGGVSRAGTLWNLWRNPSSLFLASGGLLAISVVLARSYLCCYTASPGVPLCLHLAVFL